jgi:hypothetical protein
MFSEKRIARVLRFYKGSLFADLKTTARFTGSGTNLTANLTIEESRNN